jgi:catechol 2,3-dioxygenase-like lactoylglutathione lyase family enzyme
VLGGSAGVDGTSGPGVGSAGTDGESGTTGWTGSLGAGISSVGMPTALPGASGRVHPGPMDTLTDGFAELTLQARDMAALERFYIEALGLEVLTREDDRIWLAAGQRARLGLWSPGEKEFGDEGGAHVHFAFSAAPGRLDALVERLRAHGAEVRGPEEHDGGDRSLYVEDPEGNVVEVWDFFARGRRSVDLEA